jgi:predicted PurR-regulated permease PerM
VFLWFIACYISFVLLKDYERLKKEFNESFNSQGNIFGESVSKFFFRRFFSQSVVAQYTAIFVAKVY